MDKKVAQIKQLRTGLLSLIVGAEVAAMSYDLHWTAWLNSYYLAGAIVLCALGTAYLEWHVTQKGQPLDKKA